jgi:protein TonB
MSQPVRSEVFTADELARAAGVDRGSVDALIDRGEVRVIAGTRYIAADEAVRAGRRLAPATAELPERFAAITAGAAGAASRQPALPAFASSLVHGSLLAAVLWFSAGAADTVVVEEPPKSETRLVFIMTPGPGGGGGGGGLRNPLPPPPVQRRGAERTRIPVPAVTPKPVVITARREVEPPRELTPPAPPVPKPVEQAPEPLPARVLVAPVVSAAANEAEREGVITDGRGTAPSQGAGTLGGVGTGQGTGNGQGSGTGIGEGSGGGTGGGPYRPGSGIEPPRLLREVKPEYTDDARRRGLTGEVVMEVVVRSDGTVGDVRVLRGLGAGLDQRAIAAIRQWRFAPARRQGAPVDVIVEIAVDFTLR